MRTPEEQINNIENLDLEKNKAFEVYQKIMAEIHDLGFSAYTKKLPKLAEGFKGGDNCVRCIDEGTPGGLHSAGSGILKEISKVVEDFKNAQVSEITSHDGCGAAKLYAKQNNLDLEKSDEYGKAWSQKIAAELGVPYKHINSSAMTRPKEFHIARTAYYDGTGKFNFSQVKDLPPGFIISRKIQNLAESLAEAEVSLQIALGDHGFGDLFTKDNPFILVAISESKEDLIKLKEELSRLKDLPDTVAIDGFIAPKT